MTSVPLAPAAPETPSDASVDLRHRLHRAFPQASVQALSVLDAMLLSEGAIGSASSVARRLGMRDRFALARWLAHEAMPPLHEMAGWVSLFGWLHRCECDGESLCALALRSGRDPAACYRLVGRLTGYTWTIVRARGLDWALRLFSERCRERHAWRARVRRLPFAAPLASVG